MPSTSANGLECIEEASTSSSNDGTDFLTNSGLCRYETSDFSLSTSTSDCINLQNSSINIDNSNDVVIGSVSHFHGPVSIYQAQSDVSIEKLEGGGGNEGRFCGMNLEIVYVLTRFGSKCGAIMVRLVGVLCARCALEKTR